MFKKWDTCLEGTGETQAATLSCIPIVFENIIRASLIFAGVVALVFIIYSGIKMLTSGGDPKAVEAAKKTMTFAIVGLIIILVSFSIVALLGVITGTECITSFGFDNCK
ncbi:MAG: hypothetical protein KBD46_00565 [Candidatus Levybacteria bacterium]|nr:hypothetical protein [Candidatus Levybacteria bacterium]